MVCFASNKRNEIFHKSSNRRRAAKKLSPLLPTLAIVLGSSLYHAVRKARCHTTIAELNFSHEHGAGNRARD